MASLDGSSRDSLDSSSSHDPVKAAWSMELDDPRSTSSQNSTTFFSRLKTAMRPMGPRYGGSRSHDYYAAPTDENGGVGNGAARRSPPTTASARMLHLMKRFVYKLPMLVLLFFGAVHLILVIYGHKAWIWDVRKNEPQLPAWAGKDKGLASYPTDATRDVHPIPCHSHNDYWRRVPLFDAIHWGCTGVEADVWLFDGNDELLVGHSSTSLSPARTLRSLYVDPLVELLDTMNPTTEFGKATGAGVFDEDPNQTLVLLIDFKTNGRDLFPRVQQDLTPLREKGHLSHWDGTKFISRAITVVGTGNAPFDLLTANQTYRDIFFDAPLDELYESAPSTPPHHLAPRAQGKEGTAHLTPDAFNTSNSYYASVSMWATIGIPITGHISASHLETIRGQIRGAHKRGLKARYWETPAWPTSLKFEIWSLLVREGVDMLNADDLEAAATFDWGKRVEHDWVDG